VESPSEYALEFLDKPGAKEVVVYIAFMALIAYFTNKDRKDD
jgi:hypothetical protein